MYYTLIKFLPFNKANAYIYLCIKRGENDSHILLCSMFRFPSVRICHSFFFLCLFILFDSLILSLMFVRDIVGKMIVRIKEITLFGRERLTDGDWLRHRRRNISTLRWAQNFYETFP